jgi:uncharacterized protein YlxP (DUF503 family)
VRSVAQRIRNKFQVSVAEVGNNDVWQLATIGVSCVSNSRSHAEDILNEIVAYVESSRLDAEVLDVETEVFDF